MFLHRERPACSTLVATGARYKDSALPKLHVVMFPSGLPVESGSLELRRFHRTVCIYEGKNKITWENAKPFAQEGTPLFEIGWYAQKNPLANVYGFCCRRFV